MTLKKEIDSGFLKNPIKLNVDSYEGGEIVASEWIYINRVYMYDIGSGLRICVNYPDEIPEEKDKTFFASLRTPLYKISFTYPDMFGFATFSFLQRSHPIYSFDELDVDGTKKSFSNIVLVPDMSTLKLTSDDETVKKFLELNEVHFYEKKEGETAPIDILEKCMKRMQANDWFIPLDKDKKSIKDEATDKIAEKKIESDKNKLNKDLQEVRSNGNSELVDTSSLRIVRGSKNPMEDLNKMIGLASVKKTIMKLYSKREFDRQYGNTSEDDVASMHMCFLGNPGTGKTTVARILAGIFYEMGYIKENRCVEINGLDLIGNYVGQTGIITKKILDFARGGVLFIDEAYALNTMASSYGAEAVSVLLKEMEDNRGDLVVILAGYEGPMNEFLDINSGFRSRINRYFHFDDYSLEELCDIFLMQLRKKRYNVDSTVMRHTMGEFIDAAKEKNFSNGRYVRNYLEKLEEKHIDKTMDYYRRRPKIRGQEGTFDYMSFRRITSMAI